MLIFNLVSLLWKFTFGSGCVLDPRRLCWGLFTLKSAPDSETCHICFFSSKLLSRPAPALHTRLSLLNSNLQAQSIVSHGLTNQPPKYRKKHMQ